MRIGMIGLDTSHSVAFTQLLNDSAHPHHIEGAQVVIASPGISSTIPISAARAEGYIHTLRERYNMKITDKLEEVAEASDAILLTSGDGFLHESQLQRLAPYGKPIYVDKPFALSVDAALRMKATAELHGIVLMSSSALRYADIYAEAIISNAERITSVDVYGPIPNMEGVPGWFWYGIHAVEMVYAALGPGCETVTAVPAADGAIVTARWKDGRTASIRGLNKGNNFGAVLHRGSDSQQIDIAKIQKPFYASLLEQVIRMLQTGESPLPISQTIEIIAFIEAIHLSLSTGQPAAVAAIADH